MREEYINILNEMVINKGVINDSTDGRNLLTYLHIHDVISYQDKEKLNEKGPTESIQHLIKIVLQSKNDEDIIHFLNSLEQAKYKDAYMWLKLKITSTESTSLQSNIHNEIDCSHLKMKLDEYQSYKSNNKNTNEEKEQGIDFDVKNPVLDFVGRQQQLQELHTLLNSNMLKTEMQQNMVVIVDNRTVEKCATITGLGGIGKTQLALKYAKLYAECYNYNVVVINAESESTLRGSFERLAGKLKLSLKTIDGVEKEFRDIISDIYDHFSKRKCLFIFDNADKPIDEECYPTDSHKVYILITSRYQKWGQISVFRLDNFSPEEATCFIRISLKIRTDVREDQITKLAETLHFFPLALKQATAYINEIREIKRNISVVYSIDHYIKEYNESKEKLLNYKFDSEHGIESFQTTFTTWKVTISKLEGYMKGEKNIGKVAVKILDYISYVAHEKIDMQIFFPIENEEELSQAVQILKQFSMVTEENGLLNIHPLVQQVTQLNIKQKRIEKETFTIVCELVQRYLEKLVQSQQYFKLKIILPHSEKLFQEMKNWLIKHPKKRKHVEQESIKKYIICYV